MIIGTLLVMYGYIHKVLANRQINMCYSVYGLNTKSCVKIPVLVFVAIVQTLYYATVKPHPKFTQPAQVTKCTLDGCICYCKQT